MAEELQGLLKRIQEDGLQKSETQREKIIAEANAKAAEIVAQAEAKAAAMIKDAETATAAMETKSKATIQQAARDIRIALKMELQERLRNVVRNCTADAMTPQNMAQLILEMAQTYAKDKGSEMEVLLSSASLKFMESALLGSLKDDLKKRTKILGGGDFASGLQIGFKDEDVFLDFSDDALSDLICSYTGPKIAALLKD